MAKRKKAKKSKTKKVKKGKKAKTVRSVLSKKNVKKILKHPKKVTAKQKEVLKESSKLYIQEVTEARLKKYFGITSEALKKLKIKVPNETHLHFAALDFLDMAKRYYSDAKYFRDNGDYVTAFASLNYAHAWLDAGARLGIFDVGHDNRLFTVD